MRFVLLLSILMASTAIFNGCGDESQGDGVLILIDDMGLPDTDGLLDAMPDAASDEACPYSGNGVCDEPSRCPLGTDETDCREACTAPGREIAFFAAACAHRSGESATPLSQAASFEVNAGVWSDEALDAPTDMGNESPRYLRVFVPPGLAKNQLVPAVLMLPGNRVSHFSLPNYTELDVTAAANGFIVVYVEQPWRTRTFSWSWYTDWQWANNAGGNPDLIFLERLVAHLTSSRPIDPTQIYVAGHSRGAAMSVIAALELPHLFAGAIPQSGFVEFGYFDRVLSWNGPRRPAFFFMHGALDDDVCVDCRPGGNCGVQPNRRCGTVAASDALVEALRMQGWDDSNLRYARPDRVAHRWQPWLNQTWWDFISRHRTQGESP